MFHDQSKNEEKSDGDRHGNENKCPNVLLKRRRIDLKCALNFVDAVTRDEFVAFASSPNPNQR